MSIQYTFIQTYPWLKIVYKYTCTLNIYMSRHICN